MKYKFILYSPWLLKSPERLQRLVLFCVFLRAKVSSELVLGCSGCTTLNVPIPARIAATGLLTKTTLRFRGLGCRV